MAFAECKERGVAELSMDLIGELIKKIFSSKSESQDKINELVNSALELFNDLIDLQSENIIEMTVSKILMVVQRFGLTIGNFSLSKKFIYLPKIRGKNLA